MAKVLLVEDDNNLREIYQARLMAEGYDIVAAQNGEEALVVAKQHKPDLIISDVMMPRISGFEMLDILRNTDELKGTKVIMLTALGQAEDQARADNLGADKYLVKSQVTLEDIVNAAKELLGEIAAPVAPVVPEASIATSEPAPAAEPVIAPEPATPPVAPPTPAVDPTPAATPVAAEPVTPADPAPTAPTVAPVVLEPVVTPTSAPAIEPVVQPEIVATPPATSVVPEPIAPAADVAAAAAVSQPLQTEEATVQDQINTFANQEQPAPAEVDPVEAAEEAANEEAIANAVDELNNPEPEVAEEAPAPAPAADAPEPPTEAPAATTPAPVTEESATSVGGTKIIQPLNSGVTAGPDINALLAKETAKEEAEAAAAATPAPAPEPPTEAPAATTPAPAVSSAPAGPVTPAPAPAEDAPENIAL